MAKIRVWDKLSFQAQQEVVNIVKNKENAIDLIVKNYFGEQSCDAGAVSSRFQVQNFALDPNVFSLQTEGKDGWWQSEAYEPNTVNAKVFPIIQTPTTEDEWGKNLFSSYALKELDGVYNIKYPLTDDYTKVISPFVNLEMTDVHFNNVKSMVENGLKIKVTNGKAYGVNLYKRSLHILATTKIKNSALKLARKFDKIKTAFAGKLVLAEKSTNNYKYTNIEKTVKMFDSIFKVGVIRQVKYASQKKNKKISKDVQFASRLFANILMTRVLTYGNPEINRTVEKCLSLQFSNVLNRSAFTSEQLKLITELAANTVVDTCERMGLNKDKIMERNVVNGYAYKKVPTTIKEAVLFAQEKDYSQYFVNLETRLTQKELLHFETNPTGDIEVEFEDVTDRLTKTRNKVTDIVQYNKESLRDIPLLKEPKISGLLASPSKKVALVSGASNKLLPEGRKIERLISGNKVDGYLKPGVSGLLPTSKHLLPVSFFKNDQKLAIAPIEYIKEEPTEEIYNINTRKIAKQIDKEVEETIAKTVITLTNASNANRFSKYGGKEKAENLIEFLSTALCFYKKSIKKPLRTTQMSKKNNATIYSRAHQFSNVLGVIKNNIVEGMAEKSKSNLKKINETPTEYVTRLSKMVCKDGSEEGLTIKKYIQKYIKNVSDIYVSGKFTNIFDKKNQNKNSAE